MVNRYAGEIHINPIRVLRNEDFNNEGQIKDIEGTLVEAIELTNKIASRLKNIKQWLEQKKYPGSLQFKFSEGGYISMTGLPDNQLQALAGKGLIELYDFAKEKEWVKKHGAQFGLIWENGRSVEI